MDQLPPVVLKKLLQELSSADMLQTCRAYGTFDENLKDSDLISKLDFNRAFSLHIFNLTEYLHEKVEFKFIKILNINCIYWISAEDWRNAIRKMINLECLYAIDTKLALHKLDCAVYRTLKLQKVSLTVVDVDQFKLIKEKVFSKLKAFYMKITKVDPIFKSMFKFFEKHHHIEEIWIVVEFVPKTYPLDFAFLANCIPTLKKIVISAPRFMHVFNVEKLRFTMSYQNISDVPFERHEYIFERITPPTPIDEVELMGQDMLLPQYLTEWSSVLFGGKPYGPREFLILTVGAPAWKTIEFESFSFDHESAFPLAQFNEIIYRIIMAKQSVNLRSLCVKSCVFLTANCKPVEDFEFTNETRHAFQQLPNKRMHIKELELWRCFHHKQFENIPSQCAEMRLGYSSLSSFTNLKKLTVEIPEFMDGSFLVDVLKKCQHLESLRVTFLHAITENVHRYNLFTALTHGKMLKDLRIEIDHLDFIELFSSLNAIPGCKLERLFLKNICILNKYVIMETMEEFLSSNPQLIFMFIVVEICPPNVQHNVQLVLNGFVKDSLAKVFVIGQIENWRGLEIPLSHHDLVSCSRVVSYIDFYRDF